MRGVDDGRCAIGAVPGDGYSGNKTAASKSEEHISGTVGDGSSGATGKDGGGVGIQKLGDNEWSTQQINVAAAGKQGEAILTPAYKVDGSVGRAGALSSCYVERDRPRT